MKDKQPNNSVTKFYKKDKLPRVPGASAQEGMLHYMHKVVPDGVDAAKEKYQAGHYIKEFATVKSYGNGVISRPGAIELAFHEVATLEFLRLIIPGQPKARLLKDPQNPDVCYLQSKEIKNAGTLDKLDFNIDAKQSIMKKANPEHYGTPNGYKGLGEVNFIVGGLFRDQDIAGRNYLVDDQNVLYRIDAGLTTWQNNPYDPARFKAFLGHASTSQAYIKEQNRALLKFLTLPPTLIKAFCHSHFLDEDTRKKREECLLNLQNDIKMEYIKDNGYIDPQNESNKRYIFKFSEPRQNIFPNFAEYIVSDEASEDLKSYAAYLETFHIYGKTTLISQCNGAWNKDDMVSRHKSLIEELSQYELIKINAELPADSSLSSSEKDFKDEELNGVRPQGQTPLNSPLQQEPTTNTTLPPRTITKSELANILYGDKNHAGYHTKSWLYYFFGHLFHLDSRRSGAITALFHLLDQKDHFEEKDVQNAISHDKYASHRLNLFAGKDNKNGSSIDDIIDELRTVFQFKH